ncbi:MAG: GHMP kinase [Bacteroidetes bacterium]|nr:GHMP kinase [Bacteroidota bacterium]
MIIEERTPARAGLLGNPSDGYFGKTISISVKNFGAHVTLYESPELRIEPQPQDINEYRNIHSLIENITLHGYYGGDRLIKAAIKKFYEHCSVNDIPLEAKNFTIRYDSSIPRQVGLAGSSAIIASVIKALVKFYKIDIQKEYLPTLVLKVETEELGINAGLQDRVIQIYGGCVYMDFNKTSVKEKGFGIYTPISPKLLPNLYLAYKEDLGKISGVVLNDIKSRYDRDDKLVIETLEEIASLAEKGNSLINRGETASLHELINRNFDLRCKIMNINESNKQLVYTARKCGASAKFAGSGGSIIGMYEDDEMLTRLINSLKEINARVIKPYIS